MKEGKRDESDKNKLKRTRERERNQQTICSQQLQHLDNLSTKLQEQKWMHKIDHKLFYIQRGNKKGRVKLMLITS